MIRVSSIIKNSNEQLLNELLASDRVVSSIIKNNDSIENAREELFEYLNNVERSYFNIRSRNRFTDINIYERNMAKECIRVFKNYLRTENEKIAGFSALKALHNMMYKGEISDDRRGFVIEFIKLFDGINGNSGVWKEFDVLDPSLEDITGSRMDMLDFYSQKLSQRKYASGLDEKIIEKRKGFTGELMKRMNASPDDWKNFSWQMRYMIKDVSTLEKYVTLSKEEKEALLFAEKNNIDFQITPYYLSLFNPLGPDESDRAIRAQVLPSMYYSKKIAEANRLEIDMDFMGERYTTPIKNITRRYPQIVIMKPFDSCPQICVYCQRNWEIKSIEKATITKKEIDDALGWIRNNKDITEVLITGGDPLTLADDVIGNIMDRLSDMDHVERIRIGTRTLVTVPYRINKEFADMISKYDELGKREVCMVTHFEHTSEITPDVLDAVKLLKDKGIKLYNQQVFTYYNSRKYETVALRRLLKLSGIDPYYSFNTKGKEETTDFRVPVARIQQERKEEARLLPGIVRTDEPVFNVPMIGKSHLRAWQDHEPIMVLEDGRRAYRFYPWESRLNLSDAYIYNDVSIYDYLERLSNDGEDPEDYRSIWYYF